MTKFLLAALVFFFLGTAVLYAGVNRAPFRAAPANHKHTTAMVSDFNAHR